MLAPGTTERLTTGQPIYFRLWESDGLQSVLSHLRSPRRKFSLTNKLLAINRDCLNALNVLILIALFTKDSIPCESSIVESFHYLNTRIGEKVNLHSDDDLVKLSALLTKN